MPTTVVKAANGTFNVPAAELDFFSFSFPAVISKGGSTVSNGAPTRLYCCGANFTFTRCFIAITQCVLLGTVLAKV